MNNTISIIKGIQGIPLFLLPRLRAWLKVIISTVLHLKFEELFS